MMFRLTGDWPCTGGSLVVPAGTEIDGNDPQYLGVKLPLPLPLNAKCLDQSAYDQMVAWYEPHTDQFLHLLHHTPGITPKKRQQ